MSSKHISKAYDSWTNLSSAMRSINSDQYIYATTPGFSTISTDYDKLKADIDDKLADMEGRLDVLVNDCVFHNDLDSIHNLVSNLTNENMTLHQELNILKNSFNDAMGDILNLKCQLNEMLNLISNLQYSKNNI